MHLSLRQELQQNPKAEGARRRGSKEAEAPFAGWEEKRGDGPASCSLRLESGEKGENPSVPGAEGWLGILQSLAEGSRALLGPGLS